MNWKIVDRYNHNTIKEFSNKFEAYFFIENINENIKSNILIKYDSDNIEINRMINEGMRKKDLYRILLPKVSMDEYVPSDEDGDNIVIGFYIKGVQEAVLPFKEFCSKCDGVLDVDDGVTDTIPDTYVIYVEFERHENSIKKIEDLVHLAAELNGLLAEDFILSFPDTVDTVQFDIETIEKYFHNMTKEKNKQAQQIAIQNKIKDAEQAVEEDVIDDLSESLINRISKIKMEIL